MSHDEIAAEAHCIVAPALERLESAVAEAGGIIEQIHSFASRLINIVAAHGDFDLLSEVTQSLCRTGLGPGV